MGSELTGGHRATTATRPKQSPAPRESPLRFAACSAKSHSTKPARPSGTPLPIASPVLPDGIASSHAGHWDCWLIDFSKRGRGDAALDRRVWYRYPADAGRLPAAAAHVLLRRDLFMVGHWGHPPAMLRPLPTILKGPLFAAARRFAPCTYDCFPVGGAIVNRLATPVTGTRAKTKSPFCYFVSRLMCATNEKR